MCAVFMQTVDPVRVISCGGITTHLLDNVSSSSTVDAKETETDSRVNFYAEERANLSRRKVRYGNF